MPASREEVARALAYFEAADEPALFHELLAEIAPRAKRMIARYLERGTEESIPSPAELRPARGPASRDEAVRAVRETQDFALLQVLARTIGLRVEAFEIAASADFPEGAQVVVPQQPGYPRRGREMPGVVEVTGTSLRVLLDNGDTWEGPASLARLAPPSDRRD